MENTNGKISSFKDLVSWQESHKLVLMIYRNTKDFPKEEIYGLTSQMRRAAVSITSNLAEGFGRRSYKEKIHFYYLANGSLIELENQMEVAKDVGYVEIDGYNDFMEQSNKAHKCLQGLITKSKTFLGPQS